MAAAFYDTAFTNCEFLGIPARVSFSDHVFHQYTMKTTGIDHFDLQKYLMDKGVPAMVYYPVPLHSQKAYTREEYKDENFPVTMGLCKSVISLPMHTELDEEQLEFITTTVLSYR